jgi:hypothetical protein
VFQIGIGISLGALAVCVVLWVRWRQRAYASIT